MGKTRLAQAFLHAQREAYRHGVCWIELATVTDAAALPGAIASALGVRPPTGEPLAGLAGAVAPLQMLLALDNAEHLLADVARVAQVLLAQAPGVRLVVTSQVPLKIAAEHVFRLEALAVPQGPLPAAQAHSFGAVALFTERAQAADLRFALTDANAPAVIALCGALDGLALAIELAAARVAMFGVQRLADSMQDRLQLLTRSRDRAAQARHQTLRAALEWSHALLDARERAVFRRLAVFAGSASLALIQHVLADPAEAEADAAPHGRLDEWAVLDALDGLVDRSLVAVLGADGGLEPRYRLLDSPRALALEQLQAAGEQPALRRRHAQAFAAHFDARWHERHSGRIGVDAWKRLIDLDAANAAAAIAWARAEGEVDQALTIAATWLHAMHPARCTPSAWRWPMPASRSASRARRRSCACAPRSPSRVRGRTRASGARSPPSTTRWAWRARWTPPRPTAGCCTARSASGSSAARAWPTRRPPRSGPRWPRSWTRSEDPAWPPHRLDVGLEAHSFFLSRTDAGPGAPAARLALSRRTAAIAAAIGDDIETSLNNLMDAELAAGDVQAAVQSGQGLLAQLAGSRNENMTAFARLNLGAALLSLDDPSRAQAMLRAAWGQGARVRGRSRTAPTTSRCWPCSRAGRRPRPSSPATPTRATGPRPRNASPTRPRRSSACARWPVRRSARTSSIACGRKARRSSTRRSRASPSRPCRRDSRRTWRTKAAPAHRVRRVIDAHVAGLAFVAAPARP